jgi:hypothetical protein
MAAARSCPFPSLSPELAFKLDSALPISTPSTPLLLPSVLPSPNLRCGGGGLTAPKLRSTPLVVSDKDDCNDGEDDASMVRACSTIEWIKGVARLSTDKGGHDIRTPPTTPPPPDFEEPPPRARPPAALAFSSHTSTTTPSSSSKATCS